MGIVNNTSVENQTAAENRAPKELQGQTNI
jgi:hypothetical protein